MPRYKDVVIEREFKFMPISERGLIGYTAIVECPEINKITILNPRITSDGLVVDIDSPIDLSGLYPSIGYTVQATVDREITKGQITSVNFTSIRNIDPLIKQISNEQLEN